MAITHEARPLPASSARRDEPGRPVSMEALTGRPGHDRNYRVSVQELIRPVWAGRAWSITRSCHTPLRASLDRSTVKVRSMLFWLPPVRLCST